MSENRVQAEIVRYELSINEEEARKGTTKLLSRNNKRLEVNIPAGVSTGSTVKLTGALQVTDNRMGDILIHIKVTPGKTGGEAAPGGVVEISDIPAWLSIPLPCQRQHPAE